MDEPVKVGPLVVMTIKKTKKHTQPRHCMLFKASKYGIERLEVYDKNSEAEAKIIPLNNIIKIDYKTATMFRLITSSDIHEFEASTEDDKNKWISAIQSVLFPDDVSKVTTIEEDNDLYCSAGGEGIYNVKVLTTPASVKCDLSNKEAILILSTMELQLRNFSGDTMYTWPYCYIRKYGVKHTSFTFEAGRKCLSGEGVFLFEHPKKEEIFRAVSLKMKSIKKRLSGDQSALAPEVSDLQLAVSMEARSRSPLLLSKTNNPEFLHKLDAKQKEKPKMPHKPPRKTVPSIIPEIGQDYETIDGYDQVECRNDAWRTLGLDEVSHQESTKSSDEVEEIYTSSWGKPNRQPPKMQSGSKVLKSKPTSDDSYDYLDFFGSSNKLNGSSYKQVVPAPVSPVIESPAFNLYDEVGAGLEGVRLADDSHLGYAQIRPKTPNVAHQFHNEDAYAVISKPKHV